LIIISPNIVKKCPKMPKYLHLSWTWNSKTSTSNQIWNLKIPTACHV